MVFSYVKTKTRLCPTNLEMSAFYQNRNVRFSLYLISSLKRALPVMVCLIRFWPSAMFYWSMVCSLSFAMDGPRGLCDGPFSSAYAISFVFEDVVATLCISELPPHA